jgi:hypothetical protein
MNGNGPFVLLVVRTDGTREALPVLHPTREEARVQAVARRRLFRAVGIEIASVQIADRGEPVLLPDEQAEIPLEVES